MKDQTLFKRIAAISAILVGPLLVTTHIVHLLGINFDVEIVSDMASVITLGDHVAEYFRWGAIIDMFGYYLLLVPVALYLWHWLRPHSPSLVNLYTVCGLGSLFIGASEAAIRFSAMTGMMNAYGPATGPEREVLAVVFKVLIDVIFFGLATLSLFLFAVWLVGIGLVLQRERRVSGLFTAIFGIAEIVLVVGSLFHIYPIVVAVQGITVFLSPIWALWLGIVIWRHGEERVQMVEAATAA